MKVEILKNIKYKGSYYNFGEEIKVDKEDIKEFKDKKIISEYIEIPNEDEHVTTEEESKEIPNENEYITTEEELKNMTNSDAIKLLQNNDIEISARANKDEIVSAARNGDLIE